MSISSLRFTGPWGHCLLVLGFAAFTAWYCADAYSASSNVQNLLLIGPVGLLAAVLCLIVLVREVPRLRVATLPAERIAGTFKERYGMLAACATLVVYVGVMPWIGFDLATSLFVAVAMAVHGERRLWLALPFGAAVGILTVWAMETILSVPIPSILFD